jgi:hypothetical protein
MRLEFGFLVLMQAFVTIFGPSAFADQGLSSIKTDLTYLGREETTPGLYHDAFRLQVPNGAIGNCIENAGLGEYRVIHTNDDKDGRPIYSSTLRCTVPVVKESDLYSFRVENYFGDLTNPFDANPHQASYVLLDGPHVDFDHRPAGFASDLALRHIDDKKFVKDLDITNRTGSLPILILEDYSVLRQEVPGTYSLSVSMNCREQLPLEILQVNCSEEQMRTAIQRYTSDPKKGDRLSITALSAVFGDGPI